MKESFKQKMQENKPPLTFKNTKKNICLEKKREFFFDADPYYALVLHKGVHLVDYLLGSTLSLTMRRICIVSGSRKTHRGGGGS